MSITKIVMIAALAIGLSGCANMNKQQGGTLVGAGLGGLLGSQFGGGRGQLIGVALGVLGGAFIGNQIGESLDRADKTYANRNATRTLDNTRSGQTTSWRNPDSGNSGTFTPTRTYRQRSGYCREYTQTITVAGKQQSGYGRACRSPDGTWKIINS